VIEIKNLSQSRKGQRILDGIDLSAPDGAILGLVGPHNAGKTTLLRILATLEAPTTGDARISGYSIVRQRAQVRQIIGYLPATLGIYADQTCAEYLAFFAACYGVPARERSTLVADLLHLVDLFHRRNEAADTLSPAMRQRLGLARALVNDPLVLLMDEPMCRLDPRAQVELRETLKTLREMNKTIVITALSLAELQDVCTHAAILRDGRLIQAGPFEAIATIEPPHRRIVVKLLGDPQTALKVVQSSKGVVDAQFVTDTEAAPRPSNRAALALLKELRITFDGSYADASALLRSLMHSGVQVVTFQEE
jgi:ABC-2 type transport system ATP-binding protein